MRLESKWFLYILKVNDFITDKDLSEILNKIKEETDFTNTIKAVFDFKLSSFNSEEDAEQFSSLLNQARGLALEKANELQELPESFVLSKEQKSVELDFSVIETKDKSKISFLIRKLLKEYKRQGASDLHICANASLFVRKDLAIKLIDNIIISKDQVEIIVSSLLNAHQLEILKVNKTISFALSFGNSERYRVTILNNKDGLSIAFHIVSEKIKTFQELGFNKSNIDTIDYFFSFHNGLILVTGPIGSGKTTSLATFVDSINKKRTDHILMIENPVEIVQESIKCNVTQREIFQHTQSYANAIKASLREDPDIIVIGELNDLETIEIAIKASETGHLVIGTLQTSDVTNTLSRIINTFPSFQQPQIKSMLSTSLRGIICQRLLPKKGGGTVLSTEVLVNNMAVANTITEGKLFLLKSIMQTASKSGMSSMDASIFEFFNQGLITKETALLNIIDKKNYGKLIESAK